MRLRVGKSDFQSQPLNKISEKKLKSENGKKKFVREIKSNLDIAPNLNLVFCHKSFHSVLTIDIHYLFYKFFFFFLITNNTVVDSCLRFVMKISNMHVVQEYNRLVYRVYNTLFVVGSGRNLVYKLSIGTFVPYSLN